MHQNRKFKRVASRGDYVERERGWEDVKGKCGAVPPLQLQICWKCFCHASYRSCVTCNETENIVSKGKKD